MQHEQAPILVDEALFSTAMQKFILALLTASFLVLGGWFLWSAHLSNLEQEVHRAFVEAKSPEEKRKVADQNRGTEQAALIYLNLANAALDTKPQEALELYEAFLLRDEHHCLANAARLGKAKALELMQKSEEALTVYQKITQTKKGDIYIPLALLNLSRLQVAQGKESEARQSLQELLIGYADYATEAKERLKMIPEKKS